MDIALSVARVGVEPTWYCYRRILSPLRLPIPPPRLENYFTRSRSKVKSVTLMATLHPQFLSVVQPRERHRDD